MLVITRKPGEKFVIGSDVQVTIVGVDGNRVRVGIESPADLKILRTELLPEIPAHGLPKSSFVPPVAEAVSDEFGEPVG